ncbi:Thymidylate synthase [Holothuria leucospilota]|uniref:Thymidylate synthase n=1 Tax=Holothuria leucospilota TaxID=206669 RepID=A0A9Q1CT25_HOLLE|nr:Thymidylate synthase [Holothuria leucospilota]
MTKGGEQEYVALINELLDGPFEENRTGTRTSRKFGVCINYDLRGGKIPLFSCKKTDYKIILDELLWFISGSTDTKKLNSKIWDKNTSKKVLEEKGLWHYREGDLGPSYGFQWRHAGEQYLGCDMDYGGVDQLQEMVNLLKKEPYSRRNLVSSWSPTQLKEMALPPCHVLFQMLVKDVNKLTCVIIQRSGDLGLGVPFNVASYATLTHIMAKLTGLEATSLTHVINDAHVYENHVEGLRNLEVDPESNPILEISEDVHSLEDLRPEQFRITGYKPKKQRRLKMVV